MSELLGVKPSLGVAGMFGELDSWVCSWHRYKLEGTCASGWAGFSLSLVPVGVPVILGVGKDVASTVILNECVRVPVFLGVTDLLGVELPL